MSEPIDIEAIERDMSAQIDNYLGAGGDHASHCYRHLTPLLAEVRRLRAEVDAAYERGVDAGISSMDNP